ncbi:hypothetical protein ACFQ36_04545 [Arthrobacter sp. GCM10027362]|uniref:hypothetical protein n=1 Tax=Arthrobacter sp. GCM10027362 TaxID=3273379 RepID=UPI00364422CF
MPEDKADGGKPASWWTTLPGLLTAVAAVITAVTGLLVGLSQAGLLGRSGSGPEPAATASPGTTGAAGSAGSSKPGGSPAPGNPPTEAAGDWTVAVPDAGRPVRSGEAEYAVLRAQARPDVDGYVAVTFSIKCTNRGRYDMNFWDSTFRLDAGGDSIAPTSGLNELVAAGASKTGDVLFVVPDSTREAVLRIKFPDGRRSLPLTLAPPSQ